MKPNKKKEREGLFKGIFMAYFILILHVILLMGLACVVLFFRGVVQYMVWILSGGCILILASALYFFRRLRQEGRSLGDTLNSPVFRNRSVEVNFLGGIASVKIGKGDKTPALDNHGINVPQLEDPETLRLRQLKDLSRLFENDLITPEEFSQAKQRIFSQ